MFEAVRKSLALGDVKGYAFGWSQSSIRQSLSWRSF